MGERLRMGTDSGVSTLVLEGLEGGMSEVSKLLEKLNAQFKE